MQKPYINALSALTFLAVIALPAAAQPSQKPLLSVQTGAKPNLMIALDNSGSMAFSFHESYGVTSDDEYESKYCPSPYSNSDSTNSTTFNNGVGKEATLSGSTYYCYERYLSRGQWRTRALTNVALSYSPAKKVAKWSAQRSADVNPIYYNPRITYKPRVDSNGSPLEADDKIVFVSNQGSANFFYRAFRNDSNTNLVKTRHAFYAGDENSSSMTGWTQYTWTGASDLRVPQHISYTSASSSTPGFTYAYCGDVVTDGGLQVDCSNPTTVTIKYGTPATITLPSGHSRTDCTGNICTNADEIKNILNWYRYYGFRSPAVTTAIGQALADTEYNDKLRIGYININARNNTTVSAITQTPGVDTGSLGLLRGVRNHKLGTDSTKEIYNWLYGQDGARNKDTTLITTLDRRYIPNGGTPLHNVLDKTANYYKVSTNGANNPWAKDPSQSASAANPEMSCRRSFTLLFSDGAWNSETSSSSTDKDYDNTLGPEFSRTLKDGTAESIRYKPQGESTVSGRKKYTPYSSSATKGLSDLANRYFWHEDFRSSLSNDILTRAGQPTFWQNMATYTVGYMIRPRGDILDATSGLTFQQIEDYQAGYITSGYGATTKPSWVTGNVDTSSSDQDRVDDFIQAGFSGGGRGFNAQSAEDVRGIFKTVLSDILNASGQDAGVAVGPSASVSNTIDGQLKYLVSYRTQDNSGEIEAQVLDASGDANSGTTWKASSLIPSHADRKIYTISDSNGPTEFKGLFSALPADVKTALQSGTDPSRIASDASFIDYLRGKDAVVDAHGKLFRQRSSLIGAMVNPPSLYLGGSHDLLYDLKGDVTGQDQYKSFMEKKRTAPPSLYVATNAGMMHALKGASGEEMGIYMPRRGLKRMLHFSDADYTFEYILDGPISEQDIFNAKDDRWENLAIGTGGRGERLVYAVRAPLNGETTLNRTPGINDFLWETGPENMDTSSVKTGYMTTPARSGVTRSGHWIVAATSGHHNGSTGTEDNTHHGLVLLDALTGKNLAALPIPTQYQTGRGLGAVTMVRDGDRRVVAAYAGDAKGNLWRFNLLGEPSEWTVSYGRPVFTTENNRPIYGGVAWQEHPEGGAIVVFGTGILLDETDVSDTTQREAIYGIWDPTPVGEPDVTLSLREESRLVEQTITASSAQGALTAYSLSNNALEWRDASGNENHQGWKIQLGGDEEGERNLDQVQNAGTNVFLTTAAISAPKETEVCRVSDLPSNYLYILDALTGTMKKTGFTFTTEDSNGKETQTRFAAIKVASGGFSRGVGLIPTWKSTSGSGDNGSGSSGGSGGSGDSDGYVPADIRELIGGGGNMGEDTVDPPCGSVGWTPIATPTEAGPQITDKCTVSGWTRTQYQLSAPPSN